MKTLIIVMFMLALSSPALAAKPGTEPPAPEQVVEVTTNGVGTHYYFMYETTALCKSEFGDNAAVANTTEFISAINNGLTVTDNGNGSFVVVRATAATGLGTLPADVATGILMKFGVVAFVISQGYFTQTADTVGYRVACVY